MLFQPTKLAGGYIEQIPQIELATTTLKALKPLPTVDSVPVILKKISWCESQNRQFEKDGSIHRGKINPQDVGKYQINEYYHLATSKKKGMDIYTLEGNRTYALHLYKTQGTTPWNWSKPCWGDPNRVWTEKGGEYWSK